MRDIPGFSLSGPTGLICSHCGKADVGPSWDTRMRCFNDDCRISFTGYEKIEPIFDLQSKIKKICMESIGKQCNNQEIEAIKARISALLL